MTDYPCSGGLLPEQCIRRIPAAGIYFPEI